MKSISVFCGSSTGLDEKFISETVKLGKYLAKNDILLVYGGSNVGLMSILADSTLNEGGKVTGVIPSFLVSKEIAHKGLTDMLIVEDLQERKAKMDELSDGVIALPGGFGTLDELFEMLTWAQLGLHKKPVGILNINGYYDDLCNLLKKMTEKGLLKEVNRQMLLVADTVEELIFKMENYVAPNVDKWIHHHN